MKTKIFLNITLLFISIFTCLLLFELGIRVFIKPSQECYGILFGKKLTPLTIKIGDKFHASYDKPERGVRRVLVNGKEITKGDLHGILEEDPVLGYAPKKNAVSLNGWWQSNNFGARSRYDLSKNVSPGIKRIIIFGESFTNCSGVAQEETWPYFLNTKRKDVEFVNFGVEGYGAGQCLLRYEGLKNQIDYDIVMLAFVPTADPWRDINVLRQLSFWPNYPILPRFIVSHDQLGLVKSPYNTYEELRIENSSHCSNVLRQHLRAYDRLYFTALYESPPYIGELILYKLFAKAIYTFQSDCLQNNMMKKNSEAMIVLQKIFEKIDHIAKNENKKFILVYIPVVNNTNNDLEKYKHNPVFHRQYDEMVSLNRRNGITCVDLMCISSDLFGHFGVI